MVCAGAVICINYTVDGRTSIVWFACIAVNEQHNFKFLDWDRGGHLKGIHFYTNVIKSVREVLITCHFYDESMFLDC